MTVKIEVHCDFSSCSESREIDTDTDAGIERIGWHVDYVDGGQYCSRCWPEIEKEISERMKRGE